MGAVHLAGVALGAGAERGGGMAVRPSGRCDGILGSGWQCAAGRPCVGACALSCPVTVCAARSISLGISVPTNVETTAHPPTHVSLHSSLLCLAAGPGAAPSARNPRRRFPCVPGDEATMSPSRCSSRPWAARCSGCPAVQMASPPRRVAASTLTCGCFLCPFLLRVGLTLSLPPLRRPRPPAQPPPEPATHTSELFCVFQQLKRIKQQLSPGRAWILVTLIFCVAGQGEWGY